MIISGTLYVPSQVGVAWGNMDFFSERAYMFAFLSFYFVFSILNDVFTDLLL